MLKPLKWMAAGGAAAAAAIIGLQIQVSLGQARAASVEGLRVTVMETRPESRIVVAERTNEYNGRFVYECAWGPFSDYSFDFSVKASVAYGIDLSGDPGIAVEFSNPSFTSVFAGTDARVLLPRPAAAPPRLLTDSLLIANEDRSFRADEERIKTAFFKGLGDLVAVAEAGGRSQGELDGVKFRVSASSFTPAGFESLRGAAETGAASAFSSLFAAMGIKVGRVTVAFR